MTPFRPHSAFPMVDIDGLVQECSNSIAKALEILQSCTKPSVCSFTLIFRTTSGIPIWAGCYMWRQPAMKVADPLQTPNMTSSPTGTAGTPWGIRRHLRAWSESASCNGLSNIQGSEEKFRKAIWIIVVLTGVSKWQFNALPLGDFRFFSLKETPFCFYGSNWQQVGIGLDNDLALVRR